MKALLSCLLVVGLLGVSTTQAAPMTSKASAKRVAAAKKKKKPTPKVSAASQLPAKTVQAVPAPAPVAIAPVQTSQAPIAAPIAEAKPSRFGLLIDSWNEAPVRATNMGNSNFEADTVIRPSYKLTDTSSAALGIEFLNHWGSFYDADRSETRTAFTMLDPYIMIANSNLATLPGAIKISGYFREYLPLSEASQNEEIGRYSYLRAQVSAEKDITKNLTIGYTAQPRYYLQKNLSVNNAATTQGRMYQFLTLSGKVVGPVSFYSNVGFHHLWKNSDGSAVGSGYRQDNLYAESGLGVEVISNFVITAGIYDDSRDIRNPGTPFNGLYPESESSYFLEGTLSL